MTTVDYENIDNFLLNRLEGKALADFESRLEEDVAFAEAFAEQKRSLQLLEEMGDHEMRKEVQEVRQKYKNEKKPNSVIRNLRPWMAAASILLLLGIGYWLMQGPANNQLYKQYYAAYEINVGSRDATDEQASKLAAASANYRQKNYNDVLSILESLPSVVDGKLQLMQGISYLEVDNYPQALLLFDQLIRDQDPVFQHHAIWYSAMTYLKSGDVEKSKAYLQRLISAQDPNGVFKQDEANELLRKI